MKKPLPVVLFTLFLIVYLVVAAVFLINDYGLTYDEPKNFNDGRIHLNFLNTGEALSQIDQFAIAFQIHGAFMFMIGLVTKSIMHDTLGWIGTIPSMHMVLPFLTALFLFFYFRFLYEESDATTAVVACLCLITFPRFFGHSFNNLKDVPLLIFFSCSILMFYQWYTTDFKRINYFYAAMMFWAYAILCKGYALLLPLILIIFFVTLKILRMSSSEENFRNIRFGKLAVHSVIALILMGILLAIFHMPAIFSIEDKLGFFAFKSDVLSQLVGTRAQGWTLYPFVQVLLATPLLMLIFGSLGIYFTVVKLRESVLNVFMLVWLTFTLLLPCTPFAAVYDGMRHFLMFIVPYSYFTALGVVQTAGLIKKEFPFVESIPAIFICFILVSLNVSSLATTHPYQTTYFNSLAGGLRGAQSKKIAYAYDYWLNSYKEAIEWINENAKKDAVLLGINSDSETMFTYYTIRKDIRFDFIRALPLPRNAYVLVPKRDSWPNMKLVKYRDIQKHLKTMRKVYDITRQGGEILSIYYR